MVQKKMSQPKKQDLKHSAREVSPEATAKTDKKGAASADKAFNSTKKGAKASGSKTR